MKKIKKFSILSILIIAMLSILPKNIKAATSFQNLEAACAVLAEVESGTVLYNRNMNKQHPADSLARIMTLILAVSACETDAVDANMIVEMTETAWAGIGANNTTLGIKPGEEMTFMDLMYCVALGESNEASNLIAEVVAGSVEEFVDAMNKQAKQIGCAKTNFVNAHGHYDENQYTTAHDQFLIFREAITHSLFVDITGVYRYTTEKTNKSDPRKLVNSNSLLNSSSKYYYRPCVTGMTSATYEGGYAFVSNAEFDGLSLISVVLGSDVEIYEDKSTLMRNLSESQRLLEWGFEHYGWRTVLSTSDLVAKAPVTHGDGADFVNLRPESSITLLLDKSIGNDAFKRDVTIYSVNSGEELFAPITSGDILGELTLTRDGKEYGTVKLVANTNIGLHRFEYIKSQLKTALDSTAARAVIASLFVIVIGYIALVVRYNVVRRKRLRKIAAAKKKLKEDAARNVLRDE